MTSSEVPVNSIEPPRIGSSEAIVESESRRDESETELVNVSVDDEETPSLPPRPDAEYERAASPAAPLQSEQGQERELPQVALLRSMFPDFDATVLQSVLESVDYNQDRAVDLLLGMNDPEYVSSQTPAQPQQPDLALDEQLARQLALEDQRQRPRASGQSWPRRDQSPVQGGAPYQTRQSRGQAEQGQNSQNGSGDFQQEVQETFTRIAETGKRTFSSIVSKAKAKYNEYQQSRPNQQAAASTTPQWGTAPTSQLDRHTAQQAYQQEYYGYGDTRREQALPPAPPNSQPMQGYDLSSPAGADYGSRPTPASQPASERPISPVAPQRSSLSSPRLSGDTPGPPPTLSGSPINAAKLGLLPKRPVSLLRAQSPSEHAPASQPVDPNDDDELEYVENPFEEGKR